MLISKKKEIENAQKIKEDPTMNEGGIPIIGPSATRPISNDIWTLKAQSEVIAEVFKEQVRKTSERLDLPQISLIVDELIRLEKSKPQELQLEVSQGITLILELLKSPKKVVEEGEWIGIVFERLRIAEQEIGLKAKIQHYSMQVQEQPKMIKSEYLSTDIEYKKILKNELKRIKKKIHRPYSCGVVSMC